MGFALEFSRAVTQCFAISTGEALFSVGFPGVASLQLSENRLFQKKFKRGGGLKTYFFDKAPGILRFFTLPLEIPEKEASTLKIPKNYVSYTPCKLQFVQPLLLASKCISHAKYEKNLLIMPVSLLFFKISHSTRQYHIIFIFEFSEI